MTELQVKDIWKNRKLTDEQYARNFSDLHPPLSQREAAIEAGRCYFCYDAPCIEACPTGIDIPLFIRQILTGTPEAAAVTILDSNILGGFCARVCPTETLCEEMCVRQVAEGKPVEIGKLQRFATDRIMEGSEHPYKRQDPTGRQIAVIGAGPAGLACAHRLAMHGNDVDIFERRPKPGGLNEYGIAAYKTIDQFAAREVEWLLGIGGISIAYRQSIDTAEDLSILINRYDAVFLGVGLSGNNQLFERAMKLPNVQFAVDFIEEVRQSADYSDILVGDDVVVIGGGMTAIDAAVQARLLGARNVTIAYRRGKEQMKASWYEQDLAASKGARIVTNAEPKDIKGTDRAEFVVFNSPVPAGEETIRTDHVLLAIGQKLDSCPPGLNMRSGKFQVDKVGRTSMPKVWAGGDCVVTGDDLTVTAVAQGRDAAEDIHLALSAT